MGVTRTFAADLGTAIGQEVWIAGWVHALRTTKSTTFLVIRDASGDVQVVAPPGQLGPLQREDAVRLRGRVRADARAAKGYEVDALEVQVVGAAQGPLPIETHRDPEEMGLSPELLLDCRPLALRTDRYGAIFRIQAALLEAFRAGLRRRRFTEIVSSKLVAGGTEGGAHLFALQYFERVAYLAQSPQFYKEHGVLGFERVFETGHVYRAEPHATSRHLTEYYSLDLEFGFIEGPRDVIELERELLGEIFEELQSRFGPELRRFDAYLPSLARTPIWTFDECADRLRHAHDRTDVDDDLDPEAERQLCALAEREAGVASLFVLGFPMSQRPFYTHPSSDGRRAAGFDLLLRGVEVTTGGQRLHRRSDLEAALRDRGIDPAAFESHLRMFDFGMPPHGGLAIGAERLTAQILGLRNVREATLYPRDRNRLTP